MRIRTASRTSRSVFALIAACALILLSVLIREQWWRHHPDRAFAHYTGQRLPPGIAALDYGWAINDNLLHVGRYWLLRGTPERIDAFARTHGFVESTDDARWIDPQARKLFGLGLPAGKAVIGYEREDRRDDWIWVFDGDLAIYNGE